MTDIAQFLAARLDEDQASAEAWDEAERTWQQVGARNLRYDNGSGERVQSIDTGGGQGLLNEQIWVKHDYDGERTAHIARHDPARVLAEVTAKRRIIELHTTGSYRTYQCSNGDHIQEWQCERAKEPYTEHRYCEVCGGSECVEVPLLAGLYADHPDYDPAWRVPTTEENDHG